MLLLVALNYLKKSVLEVKSGFLVDYNQIFLKIGVGKVDCSTQNLGLGLSYTHKKNISAFFLGLKKAFTFHFLDFSFFFVLALIFL